MPSKPSLSFN